MLFEALLAPSPYFYRCPRGHDHQACGSESLDALDQLLRANRGAVVAVVLEPCIQAAAGMITQPPGFVSAVRALTERHDTLLIADEVATGFGRTGLMFASQQEAVEPDLLCVAKGLTGGYLPLAATLATERIYEAFLGVGEEGKTFYHGHTYTGNPLACAAALASLDLFEQDQTLLRLPAKVRQLEDGLRSLADHRLVGQVRQCGMMAGLELVADRKHRRGFEPSQRVGAAVCQGARRHGVILRPLGDVVVLMPPLSIRPESLEQILVAVRKSLDQMVGQLI